MTRVLLLGSGPNVLAARTWARDRFDVIVAINNAWRVRPDWDAAIYPEDFPDDRHPSPSNQQQIITAANFVPAQNAFGGFVYAGGTMAFTAAYWALHALNPTQIAVMGCDMVYAPQGQTHFYGQGTADPLRRDISLRSLEAKSARLLALAAGMGCAMVNLSQDPSRLVFPRAYPGQRASLPYIDTTLLGAALAREAALGYFVPSGRYWEESARFDPDALDEIDALWLAAVGSIKSHRADEKAA